MDLLPPPGEPWSPRMMELSAAEKEGRYAPEFEGRTSRPPAPVPYVGGTTDGD